MKVYMDPIVDVGKDGTICTIIFPATPRLIDERIKNLEGFKKAKYNIDKIVEIVRGAISTDDAEEKLYKTFKLTHSQANFMIKTTFDDMVQYCCKDFLLEEIEKWKVLRDLVDESDEIEEYEI